MELSGINVLFEGDNFSRLMGGLWVSVRIAALALVVGIPVGVVLGALRTLPSRLIEVVLRLYLEFFRIVPTLVLLFLAYYILPRELGFRIDGQTVAVVAFALWIAAEMSDVVRGALISVPVAQLEGARALGLNRLNQLRYVQLPQSLNLMLPATINLATRVIKTTSLLLLISVIDLISVGQQIMETNRQQYPDGAFWVYSFIFVLYFLACYPLAAVANRLESRAKERIHG
ncbi:amino acid ABC transporter permease [Mycobacterium sp. DL592]|uniref:amino acid ABC transporter permease n=1 Tax=Mycobacterium sp. DL592 TaxID=2675524 RepID=UPI001420194E|nr:amino acid ABC transporter permease [Mycobacterium sp. DL592]